ncbi:uncharacterized protein LOC132193871 isoform X2 [Neocloeon triangulifer]|uniref:uncharacterized protein LOC132193871 isoform X2 n=1 Tax=Neocloeon triangulifer TaxID=2078957 RepID=UPI00286EE97E|nr:uncharacterized protein LOC132193871 isoform X2 [Neocloeon triangulifer]
MQVDLGAQTLKEKGWRGGRELTPVLLVSVAALLVCFLHGAHGETEKDDKVGSWTQKLDQSVGPKRNENELQTNKINVKRDTCSTARTVNLTELSNGKKYFFSYPHFQGSWSFANDRCTARGLYLANLKRQTDLDTVIDNADNFVEGFSPVGFWLSGRKEDQSSDFRWGDGTKVDSELWARNADKTSRCIQVRTGVSRKLYTEDCPFMHNYFVCELPSECY